MANSLSHQQLMALLDQFFAQYLPITEYLHMRSYDYDGDSFALAIDLAPSLNDKLTAFGGSLYCVSVMCGWGMTYLQCRQRGINPNMVVAHAEIDYLAPVADEVIVARCHHPDTGHWDAFADDVLQRGRAKTTVAATITSAGKQAVTFQGTYAVIGLAD